MITFPPDPKDGTIYEPSPGIFYKYSAMTKAWYRVSMPSIPLATLTINGLMSSEDFNKLTGIVVPPPQINLSTEDCDKIYSKGLIALKGDSDGIIQVDVHSENVHENTGIIDFKVDTEKLVQKLVDLGQLKFTSPTGDQGCQGKQGNPGANALPVGPQGPDGKDGKNAAWPGSLSEESFDVAQQGRAIVDIETKQVSSDENYLVVKRANIGNPEACPDSIIPLDIQSPWILGFSSTTSTALTKVVSKSGKVCGWACNSDLYYFDIDAIIQTIHTKWVDWLNAEKAAKEQLAETWLAAMIQQYNEQKDALCCALEACRSRTRNQSTRQYIENQRTQAALGNFRIVIGGETDKEYPPLDSQGDCAWDIAPCNYNLIHLSDPDCTVDWESVCPTT